MEIINNLFAKDIIKGFLFQKKKHQSLLCDIDINSLNTKGIFIFKQKLKTDLDLTETWQNMSVWESGRPEKN